MEKYIVVKNGKKIGEFATLSNRKDAIFLDEFYSLLMPFIDDAGDENLKNKYWSDFDKNLNFEIKNNHYTIKNIKTIEGNLQ